MPPMARPVTPASGADRSASTNGSPWAVAQASSRPIGAVADAPLGHVEHPLHRHLVDRVDHRLQVGEGVLDLAPVVEAGAADDLVRDADAEQRLLHDPALGVGAVEDGAVAPPLALVVEPADLVGDPLGLVALVVGVVAHDAARRRPSRSTAPWACGDGCWR